MYYLMLCLYSNMTYLKSWKIFPFSSNFVCLDSPFQQSTPSNNTSIDQIFANDNANSSFEQSRRSLAFTPSKLTTLSRSSLNNTPSRGLNISSDMLIMHDRNLASTMNTSSLASSLLSRPESLLGGNFFFPCYF